MAALQQVASAACRVAGPAEEQSIGARAWSAAGMEYVPIQHHSDNATTVWLNKITLIK
jgi:hypothetical protein